MEYRILQHIDEFEEVYRLEIAVWGIQPGDAVPVNMLRALQHGGGLVIGAYSSRLVGIALAFPARCHDRWVLWSHMTGIDRAYQGQGIGRALKLEQRSWALAEGYEEMRWTFDPLQRGNANFNLRVLGATASIYHIDFYGTMLDEINQADLPSDRIEAVWKLRDPQVIRRLSGDVAVVDTPEAQYLLKGDTMPTLAQGELSAQKYLVEIPARLADLPGTATLLAWRLALRDGLTKAFAQGYTAVDFTRDGAYLLKRS